MRGRLEPALATTLVEDFASASQPEPDPDPEQTWSATLARAEGQPIEIHGAALVQRWDQLATTVHRDCSIDPPPEPAPEQVLDRRESTKLVLA